MQSLRKMSILCLTTVAVVLAGAAPAIASGVLTPSVASIEFSPTEVHFGGFPQQSVAFFDGTVSGTNVNAVEITGPDAAEFSIPQNGCSGTVEPTFSCEVEVRFQPQSPGAKSAALELVDASGTVEVPLSGTAVTGTLSGGPLSFSTVVVGENTTEQVTIGNSTAGTHITGVEISGPDASSFSVAYGDCVENTLAPNNSCGVGVRFSPSSPGNKTAQLVITGDASDSPLIVPLSGVGAEGPRLSVTPQQALLGDVMVGSSLEQAFTLTNTGDDPLGVQGSFVVSGTPLMFPVVGDSCTGHYIEPAASCTITVAFRPTTAGLKDASIIMITNSQAGVAAVGLEGTGVPAGSFSPSNVTAPLTQATAAQAPTLTPAPSSLGPVAALDARPRLIRMGTYASRVSVNTGIGAVCPTGVTLCRVRTILTTSLVAHRARSSHRVAIKTPVFLGSTVTALHGGQRAAVHARLSASGLALLARRHRLKVSVMVAIAVPGVPTVMEWQTLTLTAKVAPVVEG